MMGNLTLQLAMMLGVPLAVVLPLQGSMCVVLKEVVTTKPDDPIS